MHPRARVGIRPPSSCQEKQALLFQSLFMAGREKTELFGQFYHLADQSENNESLES